jgi:hypothetical protein
MKGVQIRYLMSSVEVKLGDTSECLVTLRMSPNVFRHTASGWAFGVDIINYEKANLTPLGHYYRFVLEIRIHRQGLLEG